MVRTLCAEPECADAAREDCDTPCSYAKNRGITAGDGDSDERHHHHGKRCLHQCGRLRDKRSKRIAADKGIGDREKRTLIDALPSRLLTANDGFPVHDEVITRLRFQEGM